MKTPGLLIRRQVRLKGLRFHIWSRRFEVLDELLGITGGVFVVDGDRATQSGESESRCLSNPYVISTTFRAMARGNVLSLGVHLPPVQPVIKARSEERSSWSILAGISANAEDV